MKLKYIRYLSGFGLLLFSIFWQGPEIPNFDNSPRYTDEGFYHCPRLGNGAPNLRVNDKIYYLGWSRVYGFWQVNAKCDYSYHGRRVKIKWMAFQDRRIALSVVDFYSNMALNFPHDYHNKLRAYKREAASYKALYLHKFIAFVAALLIIFNPEFLRKDWRKD